MPLTPTQLAIVEHAKQLKAAKLGCWFIVQTSWVRDLVAKDGMSADAGHKWVNALMAQ